MPGNTTAMCVYEDLFCQLTWTMLLQYLVQFKNEKMLLIFTWIVMTVNN